MTTLYEAESEAQMTTPKKRPRDFSQAAKLVMDIATGQVEDRPPTPDAVEPEPTGMTKEPNDLLSSQHGHDATAILPPFCPRPVLEKA